MPLLIAALHREEKRFLLQYLPLWATGEAEQQQLLQCLEYYTKKSGTLPDFAVQEKLYDTIINALRLMEPRHSTLLQLLSGHLDCTILESFGIAKRAERLIQNQISKAEEQDELMFVVQALGLNIQLDKVHYAYKSTAPDTLDALFEKEIEVIDKMLKGR